jgi:glutamate decarboxylase
MLHKHIDPEDMIKLAKLSPVRHHLTKSNIQTLAYGSRYATEDIPKYKLPEKSTEARVAYQLIHDELELDGRPTMNLASFGEHCCIGHVFLSIIWTSSTFLQVVK